MYNYEQFNSLADIPSEFLVNHPNVRKNEEQPVNRLDEDVLTAFLLAFFSDIT